MPATRIRTMIATGVLSAGTCLAASAASPASATPSTSTDWGPVVTVADQGFDSLSTVTTDNAMVVAAWTGPSFHNLYLAARPVGGQWSAPAKIVTSAAGLTMTKDGNGAWVMWQGFDDVSVLRVASDGAIGAPEVIGSSSDPFVSDATIASGVKGAVAAAWHTHIGSPARFAYRPSGGDWTSSERVPQKGNIEGLVLGGRGVAQLLLGRDSPDFRHQEISYLRRSPGRGWSTPETVAKSANSITVEGNRRGDLVVGWATANDDGTFSLMARYKSAKGDFDEVHLLRETVPRSTWVALGIADDGSLVSAYRTTDQGDRQLEMTPADSTGVWLEPQTLPLTGSTYDVAVNGAGDSVITSHDDTGVQLVRCSHGGTCTSAETNRATGYRNPSTSLSPQGAITLVWGRGCRTEECYPNRLVAQRGS